MRRLLVEGVRGIAVLSDESQADGTLLALPYLEMLCAYTVVVHEANGLLPYDVCARIAYKRTWHAGASHADDAVETAAAVHCRFGLSVAKEYIENGLSYPDDFPCVFHNALLAVQR